MIDQMLAPEIAEVGPLLVVRQMRTKNERAVAHVEREAPPHRLAISVAGERTISMVRPLSIGKQLYVGSVLGAVLIVGLGGRQT